MLDDLKFIHQRDSQDALGIAEKQAAQLKYRFDAPKIDGDFQNIVFAGMGGSALPALLSQSWPGYSLPFEVCRQYHIPAYVPDKTLFIACSYSGNTEETLSALAEAEAKGAKVVVMAGGGKLEAAAAQKGHASVKIPQAAQPRYAVFYMLSALIAVLENTGLLAESSVTPQLDEAANFLRQSVEAWLPTVPQDRNPAKQLAMELAGKSGAIYAGPLLAPAAYKWKISFNENAKNVAWWNLLPEFDHNELTGWSSHPVDKPYGVVELRSDLEHPQVQKRFTVAERLLSGRRPPAYVVQAQGGNLLQQLLWTTVFGDFVTLYLALLNNVDPGPVPLVEKFKQQLSENT